jgi:excisionase family DNA binding protein
MEKPILIQTGIGRRMRNNNYISSKELAKKINVPVNTIYYWVSLNKIPYIKMGKHNRFLYREVMKFFKNKTLEKPPKKEIND